VGIGARSKYGKIVRKILWSPIASSGSLRSKCAGGREAGFPSNGEVAQALLGSSEALGLAHFRRIYSADYLRMRLATKGFSERFFHISSASANPTIYSLFPSNLLPEAASDPKNNFTSVLFPIRRRMSYPPCYPKTKKSKIMKPNHNQKTFIAIFHPRSLTRASVWSAPACWRCWSFHTAKQPPTSYKRPVKEP